jgi:hypothetical protein
LTREKPIAFALATGIAGEVLRKAGEALAEARRDKIEAHTRADFHTLERDDFGICASNSSRVASARGHG